MGTLLQDLRYGLRMLAKNPGFMAVAVMTLALGIGANAAIFSLIDAEVLKSLAVKHPEQLVQLAPRGGPQDAFSYTFFERLRDRTQSFAGMFASDGSVLSASIDGQPEIVQGRFVSGTYDSVMGTSALAGRSLAPEDDRPGSAPVAVIGYSYWKRRFGLAPFAVGKTIALKGIPFTIVGITPDIGRHWRPDVLVPVVMHPELALKDHTELDIIARLKPGVSEAQASADASVIYQQALAESAGASLSARQQREIAKQTIELTPAARGGRRQFSLEMRIMLAVVGLVLLIACVNVANLLLARASARQKEIAIRLAVGAGRGRLVRQLLTESLLLAVMAGGVGLLLAFWCGHFLWTLVSRHPSPIAPDAHILAFTAVVSGLTGIIFGLAPALRTARVDFGPALKENITSMRVFSGHSHGTRLGLRNGLVVSQVALSLIVLIGAGLLVRSLQKLEREDVGFNRENVLVMWVMPTLIGYEGPREIDLYWRLLERMNAIPGVRSASLSRIRLFSGYWQSPVSIPGYTPQPDERMSASCNAVSPRFFETMGIPLLLGRDFSAADGASAAGVAIVSETMARLYFHGENPMGKRFTLTARRSGGEVEVVGVAKDIRSGPRDEQLNRSARAVYIPFPQAPLTMLGQVVLELRTAASPADIAAAARREIQEVDRNLPPMDVQTQGDVVDESLGRDRSLATLTSFFGLLALLLASVGLYGTMSYSVSRRTNEIGIRMALGARRQDVLKLVLREGLTIIFVGLAVGLAAGLAVTRVISSQLYGVTATDPVTFIAVSILLTGVALLASYVPAWRATKVDPMVALRYE